MAGVGTKQRTNEADGTISKTLAGRRGRPSGEGEVAAERTNPTWTAPAAHEETLSLPVTSADPTALSSLTSAWCPAASGGVLDPQLPLR